MDESGKYQVTTELDGDAEAAAILAVVQTARLRGIQRVADEHKVSFEQAEAWIEEAQRRERAAERAEVVRVEWQRRHLAEDRASLRMRMPRGKGARRAK